jgi:uncharacterized damage-inducible protein DinB
VNNEVSLRLLRAIPLKGFAAVPPQANGKPGRGRDVAHQFTHLYGVRRGWMMYNREKVALPVPSALQPTRAVLLKVFRASGKAVEKYLATRLRDGSRIRYFRGSPTRWLAYMIAHESHHRGSILLTLKQNGFRLPKKVSLNDVWYAWYFHDL